jgi:hypothetical protein
MKTEDILAIIEDAFDNQISAEGWIDDGTPEATVTGKQFFLEEVEKKINLLLNVEEKPLCSMIYACFNTKKNKNCTDQKMKENNCFD